jgi:hypothetical protein
MTRIIVLLSLIATNCLTTAPAAMINGTLNLRAGSVVDHPEIGQTTGILAWSNPAVSNRSGDFVALISPDQAVNLVAPWSFESGPVSQFWSVGGFVFDLVSSEIVEQNETRLTVSGTGLIRGNGFDPTPGSWNYGRQIAGAAQTFAGLSNEVSWLSFTATPPAASVPDSGATAALLAGGLLGLGFMGAHRRQTSL